jgi:phosphotransferase system enzyme I (PtsP)
MRQRRRIGKVLTTLRRIVQDVNAARDMVEALQIVVEQVKEAVKADACTIYLLDHRHHEFVLMATAGLSQDAVRKIRVKANTGLIGLIGQREEPINLDDAPSHPNFLYISEVGEDPFKAFLGVPIIHQRKLLGVLVIQQEAQRFFDETEEAFLITLSAQLAGVIAHAEAIGVSLAPIDHGETNGMTTLVGIPCVSGIGIGQAVVVYPKAELNAVPDREIEDTDAEIALFEKALAGARKDIKLLGERLAITLPPEEQALFEVYLKLLDRASLGAEVIQEIREDRCWAQGALRRVINRHINQFDMMEDEYLRERATDIKDIGRRILSHLQEQSEVGYSYPEKTILIGDEVSAADLAEVPDGYLAAVVSGKGSSNSHVAILARALGIPTIMGATGQSLTQFEGNELIVDGYYGHVYVSPSAELRYEFLYLLEEEKVLEANLQSLRDLPTQTLDEHRIDLYVNTGLAADAGLALSVGAGGVGLYRTEVAFMVREQFPTEQEQYIIYHQLLKAFAPRGVVMRTLDIGGDKALPYFPVEEENPFLGWRGIRITLDHPEVFLVQARAMLRASEGLNNLRIMLPMISNVCELDDSLHLLDRAYGELLDEGVKVEWPKVGVMIEVPSAVYQADRLANRVDFLSVGSNDLTQYILAVDRNNSRVADLYDSLHPAVLLALSQVVQLAHKVNKPVGICGEMASDPVCAVLLLAMGFDSLSMNAGSLLKIKWVINNFKLSAARILLDEVLAMDSATLIRFHLEQALDNAGLGNLIRSSRGS